MTPPAQKLATRHKKLQFSDTFDEFQFETRSVSSSVFSSSSLSLPSASRVFQVFSTLAFLVVFLTCGMFVQHSMTMARLRGGALHFPISSSKRLMTSDPSIVVFEGEGHEQIMFEEVEKDRREPKLSSRYMPGSKNNTSEEEGSVVPDDLLEDTVTSIINDIYSTRDAVRESPQRELSWTRKESHPI